MPKSVTKIQILCDRRSCFCYHRTMTLLEFKLYAASIIFFAAFLVGLLPTAFSQKHPRTVSVMEAIASGIFLGAALFHMLPDAERAFADLGYQRFPFAISLSVVAFLTIAIVEQSAKYFNNKSSTQISSWLLLIVLSVHSLIAGATLGINETMTDALVIFLAIIAHKSSASFALVVSLNKNFHNKKSVLLLLLFFSMMTPLGIIFATSLTTVLASAQAHLLQAILNSITAGTFLYIGMLDTLSRQLNPQRLISRLREFLSLLFGMLIMIIIAIWV